MTTGRIDEVHSDDLVAALATVRLRMRMLVRREKTKLRLLEHRRTEAL